MTALVLRGDARRLPLPDGSVDLIVTSPPYFGLRSYTDGGAHYAGQIGSEATPAEWVAALVECTREWVRCLKPEGSMFVNLGDKYQSTAPNTFNAPRDIVAAGGREAEGGQARATFRADMGVRPKSLAGLPWRYALACTDQLGLILRAEIVWSKPNGLPESVTDRVRRAHEVVFHFTRQPRYYSAVDEIREPHTGGSHGGGTSTNGRTDGVSRARGYQSEVLAFNPLGKLPGSVWSINDGDTLISSILRAVAAGALTPEEGERLWNGSIECGRVSTLLAGAGSGADASTARATASTAEPMSGSAESTGSSTSYSSDPSLMGSDSTTSAATAPAATPRTLSPSPSGKTSAGDVKPPRPTASTGTSSPQTTPTGEPMAARGSAGSACEPANAPTTPGSVWSIPSQPLQVPAHLGIDHFAAFPMELPRRCILGWSPPGVCTACGQGRRPVSERTGRLVSSRGDDLLGGWHDSRYEEVRQDGNKQIRAAHGPSFPKHEAAVTGYACACRATCRHCGQFIERCTGPSLPVCLGWIHTSMNDRPIGRHYCDGRSINPSAEPLPDAPTRPAVVLDPFGGTGTTALVASVLGRVGVGVDLSHDYARLARWRTTDPGERARALQVPKPPPVPEGMDVLF